MRKNRFFVSGALLVIVLFVFGCGGGGGTDSNGASIGNTKVEKLSLNTDETDFWSDNGSVWREESREVDVFQDGNSSQSELKWGDIFPIQTGDQFNFSFEAEVVGGGEVTF
ncbi:hypothetical protein KJ761_00175, partial [Patescibacteria group bacterium]|nr:hypothetical protein [Patescibacteria group bacterium]